MGTTPSSRTSSTSAASVFPEVWVWHPLFHRNHVLFASGAPGLRERLARNPVPDDIETLRGGVVGSLERVTYEPSRPVFTDDRAPVEVLSDLLFLRVLAEEERGAAR